MWGGDVLISYVSIFIDVDDEYYVFRHPPQETAAWLDVSSVLEFTLSSECNWSCVSCFTGVISVMTRLCGIFHTWCVSLYYFSILLLMETLYLAVIVTHYIHVFYLMLNMQFIKYNHIWKYFIVNFRTSWTLYLFLWTRGWQKTKTQKGWHSWGLCVSTRM